VAGLRAISVGAGHRRDDVMSSMSTWLVLPSLCLLALGWTSG